MDTIISFEELFSRKISHIQIKGEGIVTSILNDDTKGVRERLSNGWVYGPVRDNQLRVDPYLVPWNALSEETKELGRRAAHDIIPLLSSVNLAVYRIDFR